jgi:hypothetical protein
LFFPDLKLSNTALTQFFESIAIQLANGYFNSYNHCKNKRTMDSRIQAISISSRIREVFPKGKYIGKVAGVYAGAANFSFGNYLITAADKTQGNLPYGILCDFSNIELKKNIHSGDPAEIDVNSLRAGSGILEILFQGAAEWSPEFRLPLEKKDIPTILTNTNYIEEKLVKNNKMEGLAPLVAVLPQIMGSTSTSMKHFSVLEQSAFNTLSKLAAAFRDWDAVMIEQATKGLIGLGIGLTPSGDDVLAGLFGTLFITLEERDRKWLLSAFQNTIKQISGQTTDVSTGTLNAVSEGYYPERFSTLIAAIIRNGDTGEVDKPLKEMLRWGSTSGSEIILGMLLGFNLATERLK